MKKIIVTGNPKNLAIQVPDVEIITSKDYLTNPKYAALTNVRVFNLANEYRYQAKGYYVSLLAEARGHKVVPSVKNIQDLKAPAIARIVSDELDDLIQHSLHDIKSEDFVLSIYFGQNVAKKYEKLAHELHLLFQAPLMRAKFSFNRKWQLTSLRAIPFREVPESHLPYLQDFATAYFSKKRYHTARKDNAVFDLAILINPEEKDPPSNKKAIQHFIEAAEEIGFSVELITRQDYHRIGEFDALLIRETTTVNHHTYRFARRAQSEGLVVIDDPDSILRCANKVFLAELIHTAKLQAPPTIIVHSDNIDKVIPTLGLPLVLKLPDASFSRGVKKVKSPEDYHFEVEEMMKQSDLVVAQGYMPTDFDWRIGVLAGKPLFACKYYMAKGHWQIYNWNARQHDQVGNFDCYRWEDVPPLIIEAALRITKLIGNGLYGVDIKEVDGQPYIIEVNDNPSIDAGVEDQIIGKELYLTIMRNLRERIIQKRKQHD